MSDYDDVPAETDDPDEWIARREREELMLSAVRSGTWLDEQSFAPVSYAVPGIIAEGTSLLSGPPKVGKSWLALSISLAVAAGGKALGAVDVDERPVLYFGLEDGDRRMQSRSRQLLEGDPIPSGFHYATRPAGPVAETIRAFTAKHPDTGLVVIDLLAKIRDNARPNENQYQADYRAVEKYHDLTQSTPGLAIVIVHHTRKAASDDFIDATSGTQGLAGAGDAAMVLSRSRHSDDGILSLVGREVAESEYALRRDPAGGWHLNGRSLEDAQEAATRARIENKMSKTSDLTRDVERLVSGRETTTAKDVSRELGIDDATARQYLKRGADAGRFDRLTRGVYTPGISVSQVSLVTNEENSDSEPSTPNVTNDRSDTDTRDLFDDEGVDE
jgi:RecA-family ATPase